MMSNRSRHVKLLNLAECFRSQEEFEKNYVLVVPAGAEEDENGEVEIQAYAYTQNEDGTEGDLLPIPEDSDEEWDNLNNNEKSYSEWGNIKPFCFSLIKGNKVPAAMKLVMLASYELVTDIIAKNNIAVMPENVNGLFINMKYQEGHVDIITGTSLNIFTLDKQLDTAFDKYVKTFLANAGLDFEEL